MDFATYDPTYGTYDPPPKVTHFPNMNSEIWKHAPLKITESYTSIQLKEIAQARQLDEIEAWQKELPANSTIVAYCRGDFCMLSAEAIMLLRSCGHKAHRLIGGYKG